MGPTLFLIFINDLPDDIFCKLGLFADDTTLYSSVGRSAGDFEKVELAGDLEADLRCITEWGNRWLVTFNSTKTKLLSINRRIHPFLPDVKYVINLFLKVSIFVYLDYLLTVLSAGGSTLKKLPKLHPKRLDLCIGPKTLLTLRASYTFINQPFVLVWSTAATYGQVHQSPL